MGKEGNRLEEVATGEVTDPDEVLIDYGSDEWESVIRPGLRGMTMTEIAARSGIERARLSRYLRPGATRRPPLATVEGLSNLAVGLAPPLPSCAYPGCSSVARRAPSLTCSERHRKGLSRLRAASLASLESGEATANSSSGSSDRR